LYACQVFTGTWTSIAERLLCRRTITYVLAEAPACGPLVSVARRR